MGLSTSPGLASSRQLQGGRMLSEAVSEIGVASRAGRGAGRGTYFNWTTRGSLGVG